MSSPSGSETASRELRERLAKRTRGWLPIKEWGPKCAGCGGDEYRIDGYCSIECRDYHDDEDCADALAALDALLAERTRDHRRWIEAAAEHRHATPRSWCHICERIREARAALSEGSSE